MTTKLPETIEELYDLKSRVDREIYKREQDEPVDLSEEINTIKELLNFKEDVVVNIPLRFKVKGKKLRDIVEDSWGYLAEIGDIFDIEVSLATKDRKLKKLIPIEYIKAFLHRYCSDKYKLPGQEVYDRMDNALHYIKELQNSHDSDTIMEQI